MLYTIPAADLVEYQTALSDACREEVLVKLQWCSRIAASLAAGQSQRQACAAAAGKGRWLSAWRAYNAYQLQGWRGLIPRHRLPKAGLPQRATRPQEFESYFLAEAMRNERATRPAIIKLHRDWREGRAIPGYGTWRDWWQRTRPGMPEPELCDEYPDGWSESTLSALVHSRKTELALARKGLAAAKKTLPGVQRDWSTLRPMEEIFIDDVRFDFLVNAHIPGQGWVTAELWALVAMDAATRRILHWVPVPKYRREAEGPKKGFTKGDMSRLCGGIFDKWGLPTGYPVTLVCERGTASFTDEQVEDLRTLTGGAINVRRTSMVGGAGAGTFADKSTGNSAGKAPLESFFNLMHGYNADTLALPGQTSRRYDEAPAELEVAKRVAARLAKATDSPDILMPFATLEDACKQLARVFQWAEERYAHRLLGFGIVRKFRTDAASPWRPEGELAMLPAAMHAFVEWDDRAETPLERWNKLAEKHPLKRSNASQWASVLAPDALEITYARHQAVAQIAGRKFYWWEPTLTMSIPDGRHLARTDLQALLACGPECAPVPRAENRLQLLTPKGAVLATLSLRDANAPVEEQMPIIKGKLNGALDRARAHLPERATRRRTLATQALPARTQHAAPALLEAPAPALPGGSWLDAVSIADDDDF